MTPDRSFPPVGGHVLESCCQRYIAHSLDLITEWSELQQAGKGEHYLDAIRETASHAVAVVRDCRCPWHEQIPEDYLATMVALGGKPV